GHRPGRRRHGPPPTMSPMGANVPGAWNPSASPTASPSRRRDSDLGAREWSGSPALTFRIVDGLVRDDPSHHRLHHRDLERGTLGYGDDRVAPILHRLPACVSLVVGDAYPVGARI